MKKYYYDLHIHTALSPCADDEMTPHDIAGMAKLNGLDVIAVADHNACLNCRAVIEASRRMRGALVIPATELETAEEVHVLCLLPDADAAEAFGRYVAERSLKLDNRPDIYGAQRVLDSRDNIIGEYPKLLAAATSVPIYSVAALVKAYGGVALPAHIDRPAYGVLSNLGALDDGMGFFAAEVTGFAEKSLINGLQKRGYKVIMNSDAHSLPQINERNNFFELPVLSAEEIIKYLGGNKTA